MYESREAQRTPHTADGLVERSIADANARLLSTRNEVAVSEVKTALTGEPENAEARLEARTAEVYLREFLEPLPAILDRTFPSRAGRPVRLGETFRQGIEALARAPIAERLEVEKTLVRGLIDDISALPVATWSTSPGMLAETGSVNCAGAASLLQGILDSARSATGIQTEYVNPYGHAMNVVRLSNGSVWYADPRNGKFLDITASLETTKEGDVTVHRLKNPPSEAMFHVLPTNGDTRRMMVENYAGNVSEMPASARGEFDDVLQSMTTEEDRRLMQEEARAMLTRRGLTDAGADALKRLSDEIGGPMHRFKESATYAKERERILGGMDLEEAFNAAGKIVQADPGLRASLRDRKEELLTSLAGNGGFASGNAAFDTALERYRVQLTTKKDLLGTSDMQFEADLRERFEAL